MSTTEIQYSLSLQINPLTYSEVRKLEISLMRILSYLEMATGSPEIQKFINSVQAAIVAVRSLQIAIHALEAATGPIGWVYAGTTVAAAALSGYGIYESMKGA
jgi:hypothetical protein